MRVAVVGAGLAGLAAARELRAGGHEVLVVEKSRGLGGRLAARRVEGTVLDHGSPAIAAPPGTALRGLADALPADDRADVEDGIAYRSGATRLPKLIAEGLEVLAGVRLAALREAAGGLELGDEQGNTHGVGRRRRGDRAGPPGGRPAGAQPRARRPRRRPARAGLRAGRDGAGGRPPRPPARLERGAAGRRAAGRGAQRGGQGTGAGRRRRRRSSRAWRRPRAPRCSTRRTRPRSSARSRRWPTCSGPRRPSPAWAQVKRWRFAVPAGRLDPEEVNRPGSRDRGGGRRGDRRELRRRRPPRRVRKRRAGGAQGHGDGPGAAGVSARSRVARGAAAGAVAACVWSAARAAGRAGAADRRLRRRPPARPDGAGGRRPLAGRGRRSFTPSTAPRFGAAFALAGAARAARAGLAWAGAETVATWPGMALIDRVHPDRRSGHWPPLVTNPRVFAQEALMHAVFGLVLGALTPKRRG